MECPICKKEADLNEVGQGKVVCCEYPVPIPAGFPVYRERQKRGGPLLWVWVQLTDGRTDQLYLAASNATTSKIEESEQFPTLEEAKKATEAFLALNEKLHLYQGECTAKYQAILEERKKVAAEESEKLAAEWAAMPATAKAKKLLTDLVEEVDGRQAGHSFIVGGKEVLLGTFPKFIEWAKALAPSIEITVSRSDYNGDEGWILCDVTVDGAPFATIDWEEEMGTGWERLSVKYI